MISNIEKIRNIGISAHIDSGKTTLTERILFYTQKIHAIHDVKGKDGVGATMDHMELERERGITITSAATYVEWKDHHINIIDTPGHVDFTIEVERALRVLDGAVLVLCAVAGVQSQSITVDRQMKRYKVPRIAFVNKCDRSGANPERVANALRDKLGHNSVMLQLPIGLEADFEGIIDLVEMKAIYFRGDNGEIIEEGEIPAAMLAEAEAKRADMLDAVSLFSDELLEAALEDRATPEQIYDAIRRGTLSLELTPVLIGSAYKNKGVQKLMDAVNLYLPCPTDVTIEAVDLDQDNAPVELKSDPEAQTVAYAFKLDEGRYGQLTFLRVYQGTLAKGDTVIETRTGKKTKIGRLVRMHADKMEDIPSATGGDIVGLFGIDCHSGDTFVGPGPRLAMTSMYVPDPVISLSVNPVDSKAQDNMSKALHRFTKEDPTFRVTLDPESNETIISGMGELHLEVYVERMRREYCGGGRNRRAAGGVSRSDLPAGGFRLRAQEADRRLRSVRQGRRLYRAPRRGRLRVRQRDPRRPHPDRVHPGLRQGLSLVARQGQPDRLPHRRRARGAQGRCVSTRSTLRTWRSRPHREQPSARPTRRRNRGFSNR